MDNCPNCGASFIGGPIPEDIREHYASATHWRREIGIDGELLGIYDGVVAIRCPDCAHEFPQNGSKWALEMFDKYINMKNEQPL